MSPHTTPEISKRTVEQVVGGPEDDRRRRHPQAPTDAPWLSSKHRPVYMLKTKKEDLERYEKQTAGRKWLIRTMHLSCITVNSCKLPKKSWHLSCVKCMRSANYTNEDVLEAIDIHISIVFEDALHNAMLKVMCGQCTRWRAKNGANEPASLIKSCFAGSRIRYGYCIHMRLSTMRRRCLWTIDCQNYVDAPEQDVKLFSDLCVSPYRGKFARLHELSDFKVQGNFHA